MLDMSTGFRRDGLKRGSACLKSDLPGDINIEEMNLSVCHHQFTYRRLISEKDLQRLYRTFRIINRTGVVEFTVSAIAFGYRT
jgi:hypothetical protein